MISWMPVRLATMLTLAILLGSALSLIHVLDSNGDSWDARMQADSCAMVLNQHLSGMEEGETLVRFSMLEEGSAAVQATQCSIRCESGKTDYSSPLAMPIHLWNPGSRSEWDGDELEGMDANNTSLSLEPVMKLEIRQVRIGGMTSLEAFLTPLDASATQD